MKRCIIWLYFYLSFVNVKQSVLWMLTQSFLTTKKMKSWDKIYVFWNPGLDVIQHNIVIEIFDNVVHMSTGKSNEINRCHTEQVAATCNCNFTTYMQLHWKMTTKTKKMRIKFNYVSWIKMCKRGSREKCFRLIALVVRWTSEKWAFSHRHPAAAAATYLESSLGFCSKSEKCIPCL